MNETTGCEMVYEAMGAMVEMNVETLARELGVRESLVNEWVYYGDGSWVDSLRLEGVVRQLALNTLELVELRGEVYEMVVEEAFRGFGSFVCEED